MARVTDITIDVKANLNVDRRTAETCLRLVELFCNANRIGVRGHLGEDGYTAFAFEDHCCAEKSAGNSADSV